MWCRRPMFYGPGMGLVGGMVMGSMIARSVAPPPVYIQQQQPQVRYVQVQQPQIVQQPVQQPVQQQVKPNLPPGYELKYTNEGIPYYVDHNTKTTSWTPPHVQNQPQQQAPPQQHYQAPQPQCQPQPQYQPQSQPQYQPQQQQQIHTPPQQQQQQQQQQIQYQEYKPYQANISENNNYDKDNEALIDSAVKASQCPFCSQWYMSNDIYKHISIDHPDDETESNKPQPLNQSYTTYQ
eukprot:TRINITY_DN444_c0_g2_i1.p1 TRINITY_DN444_c0_g2~~TRINITY_DN444_c0_g2_i1.p1  ORF type:complete len:236 (+),score=102.01 TRINITY_DN444_c0_g2_i1:91-798(+)